MSTIQASNISDGTDTVGMENVINGSAKSWVNFDGTGTVSIRESFNVSSITDNGTGDYTVNFENALVDANYTAVDGGARQDNNLGGSGQGHTKIYLQATTSLNFHGGDSGTGKSDHKVISIVVTR